MPKLSLGITKTQRVSALKEVLERHGRLAKAQIDQYTAARLGIQITAAFSRSLYRDLEFLVDEMSIEVHHFGRDGGQISDYDPEIHRNTVAEWSLKGAGVRVLGEQNLREAGGEFLCSNRLMRSFQFDVDRIEPQFGAIHFFFNLKDQFYCLKMDAQAVPVTLILGRRNKADPLDLSVVERSEGQRSAALLVPVAGVSGAQPKRLGHLRIRFERSDEAQVTDLGSTNGTKVIKLTSGEADKLIRAGQLLGNETLTTTWSRAKAGNAQPIDCMAGVERKFSLPILLQASEGFRVLAV